MQNRRIRNLHIIIAALTVVCAVIFTISMIIGALYVNQKKISDSLRDENEKLAAEDKIITDVFSDNVLSENSRDIINEDSAALLNAGEDVVTTSPESTGQSSVIAPAESGEYTEQMSVLDNSPAGEIEKALKRKIKELVLSDDGSPLKMLRSIFPENLIYYDSGEYVFAPVLNEVKKHNLHPDKFKVSDNGEIQYMDDGEVTSYKGIDVSKYQGKIDWDKVRADGVEFAFIRLGLRGYESGKIVVDEYFADNMRGANASGVKAGVYFFTQAINEAEAIEEANFVIESVKDYDVPCPIVFDVEMITGANGRANSLTQEERTRITIAFCEQIKKAGYTPMIYGNVKCFTRMLDMTKLNDYEKWYAFYDDYMYMPYEVSCWQYSEKGRVNGIKEKVDMNIAYKQW